MRVFLIIIIFGVIALLVQKTYEFSSRFGSLEGIVYLEQSGNKVIPQQGLTVYLILGKIDHEYRFMEQEYQAEIGSMEAFINYQEREYEKIQSRIEQAALSFRSNNPAGNIQLKPNLDRLRVIRDSIYFEYRTVKEEYDYIQRSYNARLAEMINKYSAIQTKADSKGHYRFLKIKRRKYYIFAERHSFLERYTWFVPVDITEKGIRVNLSRANLAHIFK